MMKPLWLVSSSDFTPQITYELQKTTWTPLEFIKPGPGFWKRETENNMGWEREAMEEIKEGWETEGGRETD